MLVVKEADITLLVVFKMQNQYEAEITVERPRSGAGTTILGSGGRSRRRDLTARIRGGVDRPQRPVRLPCHERDERAVPGARDPEVLVGCLAVIRADGDLGAQHELRTLRSRHDPGEIIEA